MPTHDQTYPAPSPERFFSGMQPSSDSLHLGNYLGALVQWVRMQQGYDSIGCVVDLHALTQSPDPEVLRRRTLLTAAQYIAGGMDPEHCAIFVQSHVPEHAELAWVLNCITGFGEASRMTQFKDKLAKGEEGINAGLFAYPMLMAADILLYDASVVPVGDDQKQHVELTRNLAQRFNHRYGPTFVVPEPVTVTGTARIMDLQHPTSKMSKSAASHTGVIDMLDESKALQKKVRSAVTDTGREIVYDREGKPGIANLLDIHSALSGTSVADLEREFEGKGYGDFKKAVAEVVAATVDPFRDRCNELMADPAELQRVLGRGAERAREVASATLARVYDRVGILPRA